MATLKKKKVMSEAERLKMQEYHRKVYQYRIDNGLCTKCGKPNDSTTGGRMCNACREKVQAQERERSKIARITGRCVICRKEWAIPHMRVCLKCKQYYSEYHMRYVPKKSYAERKAQTIARQHRYRDEGRCIVCGKPTDGQHVRCDYHLELSRQADKRRYERMKNEAR